MDDRVLFTGLRLLHIGFGVFWAGAMAMMAWFIVPSIRAAGPAGGRVLQEMMGKRKLPAWLGAAATLTVLSGLVMYWRLMRGTPNWARTHMAMTLGFGAVAGIVAYIIGMSVSAPTGAKIAALGARMGSAAGPPDASLVKEMDALQQRAHTAARIVAMLALTAVLAMAVARYV